MLGLGQGVPELHDRAEGANVRWILNADAVPAVGVAYVWIDTATWADANVWKD